MTIEIPLSYLLGSAYSASKIAYAIYAQNKYIKEPKTLASHSNLKFFANSLLFGIEKIAAKAVAFPAIFLYNKIIHGVNTNIRWVLPSEIFPLHLNDKQKDSVCSYTTNNLTPKMAYEYCVNNDKPIKELESIIATDPHYSYMYAVYVLKGRFPLGEKIIATIPWYSYLYAKYVLKDRFELGEPVIATDPDFSYWYATDVLNGPFPLGEKIISTSAYYSYRYAKDILKDRFELGESVVATNDWYKKHYEQRFNITL